MNRLRVAIVGCGKIADQHAAQILRIDDCELVGVCDREQLMADQLAERFDVPISCDDISHLLAGTRPDVVHVTTPPQSHFELTSQCLDAGCHVYVEKPFSLNAEEARRMILKAEQQGLKITAGHNYQWGPEMVRMRELIRSGCLGGPPVHVESFFSYDMNDRSYVNALLGDRNHWVRGLPGKLLQNVISHGVAKIAEFLDDSRCTVLVHGATSPLLRELGETEIVNELRVIVCDSKGTTAYFTFTTQVGPPVQELRVFGPAGIIVVDRLHRTVTRFDRSNSDFKSYLNFFVPPFNLARSQLRNAWSNAVGFLKMDFHMDADMKNLIEGFYNSIRVGNPLPVSYREIVLTAAIMDEIFRQLEPGRETSDKFAGGVASVSASVRGEKR